MMKNTADTMTRQEAINAMQAYLGRQYLVLGVALDNDGDWLGEIYPNDNDGAQVGTITIAGHGRCAPQTCWD